MFVLRSVVVSAVVLSLVFNAGALADQSFKISRKINNIPTTARLAVDPETGNILVAMTELKISDASFGRVRAVLLKLLPNGNYRAKKVQSLSPNSGWHGRAIPLYFPRNKMFFVVWDTGDPTSGAATSKLMGRWVRANSGKPVGSAFDIVSDNKRNVSPVPYLLADDGAAGPSGGHGGYLGIAHTAYRTQESIKDDDAEFGLRYSYYNIVNKFDLTLSARYQLEPLNNGGGFQLTHRPQAGRAAPVDNDEFPNVRFGLTIRGEIDVIRMGFRTTRGFFYNYTVEEDTSAPTRVGKTDFPVGSRVPTKAFVGWGMKMMDVRYITNAGVDGDYGRNFLVIVPGMGWGWTQNNVNAGKPVTGSEFIETKLLINSFAPGPAYIAPAKPSVAHQVFSSTDGWVYMRKIVMSKAGRPKVTGGMIKIFKHGKKLQEFQAGAIVIAAVQQGTHPVARNSNAIVVWQKEVSNSKHELWVHLFKVK